MDGSGDNQLVPTPSRGIRAAIVLSHAGNSDFGEHRQLVIARRLREAGIHCDVFRLSADPRKPLPPSSEFAELYFCPVDDPLEGVPQRHTSRALVETLRRERYRCILFKGMKYAVNQQVISALDNDAKFGVIIGGSHRDPNIKAFDVILAEHDGQVGELRRMARPDAVIAQLPKYLDGHNWPELRASAKRFDVVCNGRFIERKNQNLLTPLFGSGLRILFIGSGPMRSEIAAAAEPFPNVTFSGDVPWGTAVSLVASAKILAHPSLHEGLPRACIEALSCGVPVVGLLSTLGSALGHASCCSLVSPDDFCSRIEALVADEVTLEAMSKSALAYCEAHHGPQLLDAAIEVLAHWIRRSHPEPI